MVARTKLSNGFWPSLRRGTGIPTTGDASGANHTTVRLRRWSRPRDRATRTSWLSAHVGRVDPNRSNYPATIASTSISTHHRASRKPATMMKPVAGRISPKTSPWIASTAGASWASMSYTRVRTTSLSAAPASCSAVSMISRHRRACTLGSMSDLAVGPDRGGRGNEDLRANPHRTAEADRPLKRRARCDVAPHVARYPAGFCGQTAW